MIRSMFLCVLLAFASVANAQTPAQEKFVSSWDKAIRDNKSLIVFVGSAKLERYVDARSAHVNTMDGFKDGDIVVFSPSFGGLYRYSTFRNAKDVTLPPKGDGAFEQLNAQRAARGLPPYVKDEGLMKAAKAAADFRAANHIEGHTSNDFAFLNGASSNCAGCAAWAPGEFGACAAYDSYTYAGAAWTRGSDGLMYCHLFCR